MRLFEEYWTSLAEKRREGRGGGEERRADGNPSYKGKSNRSSFRESNRSRDRTSSRSNVRSSGWAPGLTDEEGLRRENNRFASAESAGVGGVGSGTEIGTQDGNGSFLGYEDRDRDRDRDREEREEGNREEQGGRGYNRGRRNADGKLFSLALDLGPGLGLGPDLGLVPGLSLGLGSSPGLGVDLERILSKSAEANQFMDVSTNKISDFFACPFSHILLLLPIILVKSVWGVIGWSIVLNESVWVGCDGGLLVFISSLKVLSTSDCIFIISTTSLPLVLILILLPFLYLFLFLSIPLRLHLYVSLPIFLYHFFISFSYHSSSTSSHIFYSSCGTLSNSIQ